MRNKKRKAGQRFLSVMLTMLMAVTLLAGIPTKDMEKVEAGTVTLNSPRIGNTSVTWDCVYFGSYPQAEVITSAMSANYTSVNSAYRKDGDVIISDSVYTALQNASDWDANGDITLNGVKYRRMQAEDATYAMYAPSGTFNFYLWSDETTYHYFQYQPIKWRVLERDGNDAILLSDIGLDDQPYNLSFASVTWEKSTIRSWLNGYGSSANTDGEDYSSSNFINSAFSSAEQGAIRTTTVKNANNLHDGTNGGNDTTDKIFLLSESEVYGTAKAKSYGFADNGSTYDTARRRKSSTYAKAMGVQSSTSTDYVGNCSSWWLRSPGNRSDFALNVTSGGDVFLSNGLEVCNYFSAVCPVLHLNLSSSNVWTYAGTVSVKRSAENKSSLPSVGTNVMTSTGTYKVTVSTAAKKEVAFVKPKSAKKTSVSIPATVKIDGQTYQVTEIAAKAFKNNKKIKSVTIGKNVAKIGKETFYGCKKLSSITINTAKLTDKKVGSKAFKGIAAKATIKVPKSKLTVYKKFLKKKGIGSKVKIKKK